MIGNIMKIGRTTFKECEGYIGSGAWEGGSEGNYANDTCA